MRPNMVDVRSFALAGHHTVAAWLRRTRGFFSPLHYLDMLSTDETLHELHANAPLGGYADHGEASAGYLREQRLRRMFKPPRMSSTR